MIAAKFFATIACILCPLTAFARIGETLDQCEARYGKPLPIKDEAGQIFFKKADLLVMVEMFDGKVEMISFRKSAKDALGKSDPLSDNEQAMLLEANSDGRKWRKVEQIAIDPQWQTEDGHLLARYAAFDHFLAIFTDGALARWNAAKKSAEDKKLSGF